MINNHYINFKTSMGCIYFSLKNIININNCSIINGTGDLGIGIYAGNENSLRIFQSNFKNLSSNSGGFLKGIFYNKIYLINSSFLHINSKFSGGIYDFQTKNIILMISLLLFTSYIRRWRNYLFKLFKYFHFKIFKHQIYYI